MAACLGLAACGEDQADKSGREFSLLPREDSSSTIVAGVVSRQRDLFAALDARGDIAELTMSRFAIRNDRTAISESDSSYARELRFVKLLDALNTRTPLDTSVIAMAGDLAAYRDFQAYPLNANQIIIVARRRDGPTILTNWLQQGAEWRAAGIVINPSNAMLTSLNDRWSQSSRQDAQRKPVR